METPMLRDDLNSLAPGRDFSRRDFVRTSVGSGFAAAVLPVMAQTLVKTDTQGLDAGEVTIPVGDFKLPAYRAAPAGRSGAPVLLLVSEIFGVHEHIADVARRFAKQGWCAIAPELFVRQGDAGSYGEIAKLMSEVIAKVPDAQVCADLDATLGFARASGHADAKRKGPVGYCWGGRTAWVYARHNGNLNAAVAYDGLLEGLKTPELRPQDPIDFADEIRVPVLGL